jgi:hypothetical protein
MPIITYHISHITTPLLLKVDINTAWADKGFQIVVDLDYSVGVPTNSFGVSSKDPMRG